MGQLFEASAYDIETKTCCTVYADKFHANCYSYSGAVGTMHYLLRQKPYRVMWGGNYVDIDDNIQYFSREEDLMGLSTYAFLEYFKEDNSSLNEKSYFEKLKRIESYREEWTRLDVYEEASVYFNLNEQKSVRYKGYLINHTQKLAIDLASYFWASASYHGNQIALIDLVPALTETGGGLEMALFEGISAQTTEELGGTWCGDLLQIVDELPIGYELLTCCFANVWTRAHFCYELFGVDEEGYVLNDNKNNRYEVCEIKFFGERGVNRYVKAEVDGNQIKYCARLD